MGSRRLVAIKNVVCVIKSCESVGYSVKFLASLFTSFASVPILTHITRNFQNYTKAGRFIGAIRMESNKDTSTTNENGRIFLMSTTDNGS